MPNQKLESSSDGSILEFPDLEERLGKQIVNTAAHVLDRDLLQTGEVQDDLFISRIRGIDTPEELAAYRAVKTRARNREQIHDLLTDRAEFLAEHGYRPDNLVASFLDQNVDLPERFRIRVPLWVSTYDLRERSDPDRGTERQPTKRRARQSTTSASSSRRTTQISLLADGGVSE